MFSPRSDSPARRSRAHQTGMERTVSSYLTQSQNSQLAVAARREKTAGQFRRGELCAASIVRTPQSTVSSPEFHHLIKRLRDRVNALAWFYSGAVLNIDFAEFGRRAERIVTVDSRITWIDRQRPRTSLAEVRSNRRIEHPPAFSVIDPSSKHRV